MTAMCVLFSIFALGVLSGMEKVYNLRRKQFIQEAQVALNRVTMALYVARRTTAPDDVKQIVMKEAELDYLKCSEILIQSYKENIFKPNEFHSLFGIDIAERIRMEDFAPERVRLYPMVEKYCKAFEKAMRG